METKAFLRAASQEHLSVQSRSLSSGMRNYEFFMTKAKMIYYVLWDYDAFKFSQENKLSKLKKEKKNNI